ncbi:putative heterocyst formation HetP-like protein [Lyngbya aestuarii BL J]|mgnify:CR=1 FL=1|uniref:Putative heterocyst formation HetP-like protein n=1 Tax=Lyngbya aestuarii BL J TaxID=1348334 RepID=U7QC07_9CYAN|nr:HetP family heterocyst commitment protein [Lyngbya aestuarii]ERT04550.1 putative heterocyst formation HetP-like protein [Lyngbya aestuarii BL J]
MNYSNTSSKSQQDKAMSEEQFNQVIDAILAGKYSWACVLILRFAGYNPLHYIPYRTYNRLIKDNSQCEKNKKTSSCKCDRARQKVS